MKKKLSIIFCIMLLVAFALPATAFAGIIPTYDAAETAQLKAFLNLDSAEAGKTNGQQINASYDENDPSTWSGITWNTSSSPYHAELIYWNNSSLKGDIDISNFTYLTEFYAQNNELSSLLVSGDTLLQAICVDNNDLSSLDLTGLVSLADLTCSSNNLSQITLTDCADLYEILANNNDLTSLDLSDCVMLRYLFVNTNKLTSLDLNGSIAIKRLDCSYNSLSSLDVHDQTGLNYLYCNNNKLTALNVTDLDSLLTLICNDNKLSGTFDLTSLPGLRYFLYQNNSIASLKFGDEWLNLLIGYNNPTTSITTKMFTEDSSEQTFSANSGGYLSFNMNSSTYSIYLYSQSKENNVFVNYTTDGSQISVSPIHYINPGDPDPNDIAANFSAGLASSDEDGIIYEGGRITLSPYYSDGTWGYNENYFSATFTDPNSPVFKGLKKGTTTITYTMPANTYTYEEPFEFIKSIDEPIFTTEDEENPQYAVPDLPDQNLTISMTVTINETVLPQTGQDFTVSVILAGTGLAGITALFLVSRKKKKSA